MTSNQVAVAARADLKWLLNSSTLLGRRVRHTSADSRWWGLVRLLTESLAQSLETAAEAATSCLQAKNGAAKMTVRSDPSWSASLVIDLPRFESIFLGNLSRALVLETPRRRGRQSRARVGAAAISAAENYGVDLGLVRAALARTPAERLAMLDSNVEFIRGMRRRKA
jgi:hypothetical protein